MIFSEKIANPLSVDNVKEVTTNRQDAMRGRVRTKLNDGEDLIINLPRGETILQGDLFGPSQNGDFYKISIQPERVIKVNLEIPDSNSLEQAIKLGYNLGNRHLEVLIENNDVYVPITLGEEKITKILQSMKLPIKFEPTQKIISMSGAGYHGGEENE
jgi:urease accessory protein